VAIELDGGSLALSMRTWKSGEPGPDERDPRPPDFRDVEATLRAGPHDGRALALAIAQADALTARAPQSMRWFDLEHGRVVSCDFADAGGAGRLLSPRTRELLLEILAAERALAAAPTRDTLLACADDDDDGAAWLRKEAQGRFLEGPFPIHAGLWRVTADSLQPVAADEAGKDA
jgi:hypothetical protein